MGLPAIDITKGLDLSRLVEELAAGLRPPHEVWLDHGIVDRETAAKLIALPVVQEMFTEARARWHSKSNIRERIRSKSLVVIEQSLAEMTDEALNKARPLNHRAEMWKLISKFAGLDAEAGLAGGLASGVQITIDLSGGTPPLAGERPDGGGVLVISGGPQRLEDDEAEDVQEVIEMPDEDEFTYGIEVDVDAEIDDLAAGISEEVE